MKSTELRIGNWVFDRGNNPFLVDHWESRYKIATKTIEGFHESTEYINFIKPIPLTEEWLLKFGFRHSIDSKYVFVNSVTEIELFNSTSGVIRIFYKCKSINIDIKHVHQLQNLYHALTGEEL
jgi:hypothetical protein